MFAVNRADNVKKTTIGMARTFDKSIYIRPVPVWWVDFGINVVYEINHDFYVQNNIQCKYPETVQIGKTLTPAVIPQ